MLSTLKKLVRVGDWLTNKIDWFARMFKKLNIKYREWKRRKRYEKVEKAIDSADTDTIADIVQYIRDRQKRRRNSS